MGKLLPIQLRRLRLVPPRTLLHWHLVFRSFLVLLPVGGPWGHAGDAWFVDASFCVKGGLEHFRVRTSAGLGCWGYLSGSLVSGLDQAVMYRRSGSPKKARTMWGISAGDAAHR